MPTAIDTLVISDCHLGTPSGRSRDLLAYLRDRDPERVIVAGDLMDLGAYWRGYWPEHHQAVLDHLMCWAAEGREVIYVIGNHDHPLRRYCGTTFNGLQICDRYEIDGPDGKTLVVHGDCLDDELGGSKILQRIGGWSYEFIMRVDSRWNRLRDWLNLRPASLANAIKKCLPGTEGYVEKFRVAASELAARDGYKRVICGHIHVPEITPIVTEYGVVEYCNSGDWVEHCTSLELVAGEWRLNRVDRRTTRAHRALDAKRKQTESDAALVA